MDNRIRPGQRLTMHENGATVVEVIGADDPEAMPGHSAQLVVVFDNDKMLEVSEWTVKASADWRRLPGVVDAAAIRDARQRGEILRAEQEEARRLTADCRRRHLAACRENPTWFHLEASEPGCFGDAKLAARNIRRELVALLGESEVSASFEIVATDDQVRVAWAGGPGEDEIAGIAMRYRVTHATMHDDPRHTTVWNEVYGSLFAFHLSRE